MTAEEILKKYKFPSSIDAEIIKDINEFAREMCEKQKKICQSAILDKLEYGSVSLKIANAPFPDELDELKENH